MSQSQSQQLSDVPLYERPGQALGSTWTERLRRCLNCEHSYNCLIDWTDGTKLCFGCSEIRRKNLRIARAKTGERP